MTRALLHDSPAIDLKEHDPLRQVSLIIDYYGVLNRYTQNAYDWRSFMKELNANSANNVCVLFHDIGGHATWFEPVQTLRCDGCANHIHVIEPHGHTLETTPRDLIAACRAMNEDPRDCVYVTANAGNMMAGLDIDMVTQLHELDDDMAVGCARALLVG